MTDNWRPLWQGPNAVPPTAGPPRPAGQQPPTYRPAGQQPPAYQSPGGYQGQGRPVASGQSNPPTARYSALTPAHGYPAQKATPQQAWSQAPPPTGRLAPIPGRPLEPGGEGGAPGPARYGGPPMPAGPGRPGGFGPQGPKKRSAVPWIAASAVVVVAVAAAVILLTHWSGGNQAGPIQSTSATDTAGTIRAYPSVAFSANAADAAQQQKAQQVGEAWVKAVNATDRDSAVTYMCAKNQDLTASNLFTGIQPGSMKAGQVAVNGKRATLPLTLNDSDGKATSASLPMTLQSNDWKVCLT